MSSPPRPAPSPSSPSPRKRLKTMAPRRKPPPARPPTPPPPPDLVIEGTIGEGGGQVVRLSLALATVFSRSVLVSSIRAERPKPGLNAQHVAAADLVASLADARLSYATQGSKRIQLGRPPGPNDSRAELSLPARASASTAAATSLMLQAGLPPALRFIPGHAADPRLLLSGGTTAAFAPCSDYVIRVLIPNLRLFGLDMKYDVAKDGFFPRGGGSVSVSFDKTACAPVEDRPQICTLNAVDLSSQGCLLALQGDLLVCGQEYVANGVVEAMLHAATENLRYAVPDGVDFVPFRRRHITVRDVSKENTSGKCLCLTLFARTSKGTVIGATALWSEKDAKNHPEWGKLTVEGGRSTYKDKVKFWRTTAAAAAREASSELCDALKSGAAVDEHMADQLVVFMAMAKGTSRMRVPKLTPHLMSVLAVCQKYGVDVKVEQSCQANSCVVFCSGAGIELVR